MRDASVNLRQLVAQAFQWQQTHARLKPRAREQHETDDREREFDIPAERLTQSIRRLRVQRHGEAKDARGSVAVKSHFALHHKYVGVVRPTLFDGRAAWGQMHGFRRLEVLVPKRTGPQHNAAALGHAPIGAACRQIVSRICQQSRNLRAPGGIETEGARQFTPARLEILLHQALDVVLKN